MMFYRGLKRSLLTCAVSAAAGLAALAVPSAIHAAPAGASLSALSVKVQINTELVQFPDAQPYIDNNGFTQVPVRFVSEELGFKVDWENVGGQTQVNLTGPDGKQVELTTGNQTALVNGQEQQLNTAPVLKDGRVYVPLRFISEAEGIRVQWDSVNFIAILNEDGRYHAPAWYAPKLQLLDVFTASAYTGAAKENGGYGSVDYFGNPLKLGTVAVDPKVIPLGTKLYVEGYDFAGLPTGGMVVEATDTGGALKGNRIDIFIPGTSASIWPFGLQQVRVYKMPS